MSEHSHQDEADHARGHAIAIVSGKGGSGKTMFAVSMAQGLALCRKKVMLVDTDFGTGGLSYYLMFRTFRRAKGGIADVLQGTVRAIDLHDWAAIGRPGEVEDRWLDHVRLVPIGDQRQIGEEVTADLSGAIKDVLDRARQVSDVVIVDCRGGIDRQSISVCAECDSILVVVETDPTSIQSSQHLVEVLSKNGLVNKLVGFVLNKVMDDPTNQAKTGSSLLRTEYLGAIPFDIDATRAYIQGKVPGENSLFARHVFGVLPKLFPYAGRFDDIRMLSPEEFGTITLKSPEGRSGAMAIAAAALYCSIYVIYVVYNRVEIDYGVIYARRWEVFIAIGIANVIVIASLTDAIKQGIGRGIRAYTDAFRKVMLTLRKTRFGTK